jgi:hypothetical protein
MAEFKGAACVPSREIKVALARYQTVKLDINTRWDMAIESLKEQIHVDTYFWGLIKSKSTKYDQYQYLLSECWGDRRAYEYVLEHSTEGGMEKDDVRFKMWGNESEYDDRSHELESLIAAGSGEVYINPNQAAFIWRYLDEK